MKMLAKLAFALLAVLLFVPAYVSAAPEPGRDHPAYLHALTDLRAARANLQRPDGGELRDQEKKAIHEIDDAIAEIKKASIEDGKDLNDHLPVDAHLEWGGRLRRAAAPPNCSTRRTTTSPAKKTMASLRVSSSAPWNTSTRRITT